MRFLFIAICLIALLFCPTAWQPAGAQREADFSVGELNCENLFDTVHAEGMSDADFTPEGERRWDTRRYRRKLDLLARAIVSLDPVRAPDAMALLEVENDSVLADLTRRTRLARLGYRYIKGTGSDPRGINTALLYLEGSFRPVKVRNISWDERIGIPLHTRSTLHIEGITRHSDTLHLLIIHAPSRLGGLESERHRRRIFSSLRNYTDSIMSTSARANIILIGDFNEPPDAASVRRYLGASAPEAHPKRHRLYNLALAVRSLHGSAGTYRYRGHWQMLDQCIVSGSLLKGIDEAGNSSLLFADSSSLTVVDHLHFLEQDPTYGGLRPWRTYNGPYYRGGLSDHLPILLRLYRNNDAH